MKVTAASLSFSQMAQVTGARHSMINSLHGHPLPKALRNLHKAIATMREGDAEYKANKKEKLVAYETKSIADCAKKLSDKVDLEAEIDDQLLVVIEEALEQRGRLATY